MRKLLFRFVAVFLMAGPFCTSVIGEEASRGKVTWGISQIGDGVDGALILNIIPKGAADEAGLRPGDVITSADGVQVRSSVDLKERIKHSLPYTPVSIAVQRFGTRVEKTLMPTGVFRLELKDVDRSFSVPGVPKVSGVPATALDALEDINILQNVIIDRKSGQIAVIGSYDPKYATGPIPYLDLLKTALRFPGPKLNLTPERETLSTTEEKPGWELRVIPVLLGIPAAERERQALIREMAAAYGLTREEYVRLFNYAYLDAKGGLAPVEIGQILMKAYRHLGLDNFASAYERLAGNTNEDYWQALKLLDWSLPPLQKLLAEVTSGTGQSENKLLAITCAALTVRQEKKGLAINLVRELLSNSRDGHSAQMCDELYTIAAVWLTDKNGRSPVNASLLKTSGISGEPARIALGLDPQVVRVVPIDLDPTSRLARIMYEADYVGKTFIIRPDLFEGIPGQISWSEYVGNKLRGVSDPYQMVDVEYWFEPKRVEMQISSDESVVSFGAAEINFKTLFKEGRASSLELTKQLPKFFNDWVKQYTEHYDSYAQVMPAFHGLREAAKVLALARWLKQEKIAVDLSRVEQEEWKLPEKIFGFPRYSPVSWETASGKTRTATVTGVTGGVTFQGRGWTSYGPASKTTETRIPDQLVLSSHLGQKAAQAAKAGDLESARHLAELSAQALAGHVTRGELAKQNITLPSARTAPLSPARVQLQKELLKETHNQISALRQNSANAQAAANLGRINDVYEQVQSNPPRATEYLRNLQIRQALPTTPTPTPTTPTKGGGQTPVPADSHAAPPASAAAPPEATYDCSLCDDGLRRNIRAKLDINAIRMLGTYVDGSISFYNNCKLKATKTCEVGDQFVRLLRVCDDRRADETAYYVCINDLMSLRP
jgi:PDZ domain